MMYRVFNVTVSNKGEIIVFTGMVQRKEDAGPWEDIAPYSVNVGVDQNTKDVVKDAKRMRDQIIQAEEGKLSFAELVTQALESEVDTEK